MWSSAATCGAWTQVLERSNFGAIRVEVYRLRRLALHPGSLTANRSASPTEMSAKPMKRLVVTASRFHAFAFATLLAGCGASHLPSATPGTQPPNSSLQRNRAGSGPKYQVIYNFGSHSGDGFSPYAGLVAVNGTLYGTTYNGGPYGNCGVVFSMSTSGQETVLHNFGSSVADGCNPGASLIYVNGKLYGTTQYGGRHNGGAIFSITPSGKEKLFYSFGGSTARSDGTKPLS